MSALKKLQHRIRQRRVAKARSKLRLVRKEDEVIAKKQSDLRAWIGTVLFVVRVIVTSGLWSNVFWPLIEPYWAMLMRFIHHIK